MAHIRVEGRLRLDLEIVTAPGVDSEWLIEQIESEEISLRNEDGVFEDGRLVGEDGRHLGDIKRFDDAGDQIANVRVNVFAE